MVVAHVFRTGDGFRLPARRTDTPVQALAQVCYDETLGARRAGGARNTERPVVLEELLGVSIQRAPGAHAGGTTGEQGRLRVLAESSAHWLGADADDLALSAATLQTKARERTQPAPQLFGRRRALRHCAAAPWAVGAETAGGAAGAALGGTALGGTALGGAALGGAALGGGGSAL